jgi:hypothetical protein
MWGSGLQEHRRLSRKPSPYDILGLRPGASREAVEAAYRRLIKQHHPDVGGGNGEAARAVIEAYRELRRHDAPARVVVEAPPAVRASRRPLGVIFGLVVAAGLIWLAPWSNLKASQAAATQAPLVSHPATMPPLSPLLLARVDPDVAAVESGVAEARRIERQSPEQLPHYSRSCAADLQRLPGDALLDHCLGFDMAAAYRSRFAGMEQRRRHALNHLQAAQKVLRDPLLAEARVGKIRQVVERKLLEDEGGTTR